MNTQDEPIINYSLQKSDSLSSDLSDIIQFTEDNEHWSQMLTGRVEILLIKFLLKTVKAKRVLEFGTFTGYSALSMAEELPMDGEVITIDKDKRTQEIAKGFWSRSKAGHKIKPHLGNGIDIIQNLIGKFDFIFIDADKVNYKNYFDFAIDRLNDNGIIAIDNVLWSGKVITDNNDKSTIAIRELNDFLAEQDQYKKILLPVGDGLFLIQKN